MARILSLKPEDENKLHPEAVRWLNARIAEIQFEVPLEELSDDDLNTFLSDDEKREFIRYKDEIARGLVTCIKMDEASHDLVTNATIGLNLVKFQVNSLLPISRIGLLLKHVYQRKVAKAKQEQKERDEEEKRSREQAEAEHRRKEEKERWQAAQKAVGPPLNDAKRYLNNEEHDDFIEAAREAIEVYQEKREDYLDDSRTFDYRWCLKKINDKKEEERQKIVANIAAQEYNQRLNDEKVRLKASRGHNTSWPGAGGRAQNDEMCNLINRHHNSVQFVDKVGLKCYYYHHYYACSGLPGSLDIGG